MRVNIFWFSLKLCSIHIVQVFQLTQIKNCAMFNCSKPGSWHIKHSGTQPSHSFNFSMVHLCWQGFARIISFEFEIFLPKFFNQRFTLFLVVEPSENAGFTRGCSRHWTHIAKLLKLPNFPKKPEWQYLRKRSRKVLAHLELKKKNKKVAKYLTVIK